MCKTSPPGKTGSRLTHQQPYVLQVTFEDDVKPKFLTFFINTFNIPPSFTKRKIGTREICPQSVLGRFHCQNIACSTSISPLNFEMRALRTVYLPYTLMAIVQTLDFSYETKAEPKDSSIIACLRTKRWPKVLLQLRGSCSYSVNKCAAITGQKVS